MFETLKYYYANHNNIMITLTILSSGIFSMFIFYFIRYRKTERNAEIASRNTNFITSQFIREWFFWTTSIFFKIFLLIKAKPNHISFLSLLSALYAGFLYFQGQFAYAGWIFVLSGILDSQDGKLARHYKIESKKGAFFDSVLDRYADFFVNFGIIIYFLVVAPLYKGQTQTMYIAYFTMFAILGSTLISYSKERGLTLGAKLDNRGIMQRGDRIYILTASSILDPVVSFYYHKIYGANAVEYHLLLGLAIILIAVFSNITALRRIIRIYRDLG